MRSVSFVARSYFHYPTLYWRIQVTLRGVCGRLFDILPEEEYEEQPILEDLVRAVDRAHFAEQRVPSSIIENPWRRDAGLRV